MVIGMLMTGVVPDTFPSSSSFLDEEIEYLEFENLIEEIAERLEANWSYNPDEEAYQIEFIDEEGTLHEAVTLSIDLCEEGFNEGRDLISSAVYLADYDSELHQSILPEILQLTSQLTFSRLQLNDRQQLELVGKALYHQELASDVITTMVEEMSSLAADFRLKLESAAPANA